ncbi:glycosyltransferase family 4 protein [Salinigranum marinum]|uniref:glycosyltransferase family 4 protein n=1 Tax=Salinigranum marinum TaxID=1515595 RepID=UPI002989DEBB|nr:glycosyltransferase family 4 protein [Salinigranum marinum]
MHVAFVSMRTAQQDETGATARTRRVAEAMADRGHDVTVCCSQWWGGTIPEFEQNDVVYRAVTEGPAVGAFGSKLPLHLLKTKPDVVQAVNSPPGHVVAAKRACRLLRVPLVVDWWRDSPDDDWVGYKRAARAAATILVPSELVRTGVREHGASAEQLRIVPESIDTDLVRDAPVDRRADLVYAHDLDETANVESFLLALAELRTQSWRAAVIGDGPARAAAEETAAELRIDDRVEFLGDLPSEEFVPILKGARVFAQTAAEEPFATGLLWALACGCVGLVEYQAGSSAHELVEGEARGRCVTSPQELADAIVEAADDDHRTRSEAYDAYDHDAVLDRYLDAYRDAIDDRGFSLGLF